jgi:CHAD domain-containing protein
VTRPATSNDPPTPLLQERVRVLFRHLPGAVAGNEEPVHQMRVAGRRLRVALPLLARKPAGRRVRRALRGLRTIVRAAGTGRDLDVCLALFAEQAAARPDAETRRLLQRLRDARRRSRARMAGLLLDLPIARLRRDLRRVVTRGAEPLFTVLVRLRAFRDEEGGRLLQGLAELGDRFDADALHGLRRRARRLRYAAEVADALRGQDSGAAASFKDLQDRLGRIHDEHVLAGWMAQQARANERRGQAALAARAVEHEAFFRESARARHAAFLEHAPADLVRAALDAMAGARSAA